MHTSSEYLKLNPLITSSNCVLKAASLYIHRNLRVPDL